MKAATQWNNLGSFALAIALSTMLTSAVACSTNKGMHAQADDAATTAAVKSRLMAKYNALVTTAA